MVPEMKTTKVAMMEKGHGLNLLACG